MRERMWSPCGDELWSARSKRSQQLASSNKVVLTLQLLPFNGSNWCNWRESAWTALRLIGSDMFVGFPPTSRLCELAASLWSRRHHTTGLLGARIRAAMPTIRPAEAPPWYIWIILATISPKMDSTKISDRRFPDTNARLEHGTRTENF